MDKTQETLDMFGKLGNQSFDSLKQLGELQMNAWAQLMDKQVAMFNNVLENTSKQAELVTSSKTIEEKMNAQMELSRDFAENMMEKTRESVELAQETTEAYRQWAEKNVETAKQQFETATAA
ncbi:MAG: phasin family protein [Gammaproteobacteria bacterium]|nr:phasin family protein [Gammaproteobacteria bacterium]